jgi:hypothetical protein
VLGVDGADGLLAGVSDAGCVTVGAGDGVVLAGAAGVTVGLVNVGCDLVAGALCFGTGGGRRTASLIVGAEVSAAGTGVATPGRGGGVRSTTEPSERFMWPIANAAPKTRRIAPQ